jgi:hypothetical protein
VESRGKQHERLGENELGRTLALTRAYRNPQSAFVHCGVAVSIIDKVLLRVFLSDLRTATKRQLEKNRRLIPGETLRRRKSVNDESANASEQTN